MGKSLHQVKAFFGEKKIRIIPMDLWVRLQALYITNMKVGVNGVLNMFIIVNNIFLEKLTKVLSV